MKEPRRQNTQLRIMVLSVALGLATGMADVLVDAHVFNVGELLELIFEPTPLEIYIRGLILAVFIIFGWITSRMVARLEESEAAKAGLISELERTIEEVQTLRGIIPICASCKKVRDDAGAWHQVEVYVRAHSGADFSHGLCPECLEKAQEELDQYPRRADR